MIIRFLFFYFFSITLFSQSESNYKKFNRFFYHLKCLEFDKSKSSLKNINSNTTNNLVSLAKSIELNNIVINTNDNRKVISKKSSNFDNSIIHLINGYKNSSNPQKRPEALISLKKALSLAEKTNYNPLIKSCFLGLLKVYHSGIKQDDLVFTNYLNDYEKYIIDNVDQLWFNLYKVKLFDQTTNYYANKHENDSFYFKEILNIESSKNYFLNHDMLLVLIDQMLGDYYVKYDGEKAKKHYLQALKNSTSKTYFKSLYFRLRIDLARCEAIQGNYKSAINKIIKAKKYIALGDTLKNKLNYNFFLSEYYNKISKHDSAFYHIKKVFKHEKVYNYEKHNSTISQLEVELKTKEKEKQVIIEQQEKKRNRNIAIALAGLLFFGYLVFFLIQKSTKRKQLLAEQEKELEKQKVATLLKDQEINSINAMVEGQEKERQRIANDLHDDLGGLMATIKLHFNALKEKQTAELFTTTNDLLNDAYNKIRSIAHAKNSGMIAKQGLLKAIENMASKISNASNITIEVSGFGLENRLENSLEITIFRIVQELTTNIIKHAEATQATISLTNHDDRLNIMIEDNGKGFNSTKVVQNQGMGLHSIEKRIEHLEGEIKIESQPNNGTTVIIDIPL